MEEIIHIRGLEHAQSLPEVPAGSVHRMLDSDNPREVLSFMSRDRRVMRVVVLPDGGFAAMEVIPMEVIPQVEADHGELAG